MERKQEFAMGRFDVIYPFTSENIAGYMEDLDLTNKKIITVTASSDHILNAIAQGALDITTFDINPETRFYMELKLAGVKRLEYEDFLKIFLLDNSMSLNKEIIMSLITSRDCQYYWEEKYRENKNNGLLLKKSSVFYRKYFNTKSKLKQNIYLNKSKYQQVQKRLEEVKINFINTDLKNLHLKGEYDDMFLSNISDYISLMYQEHPLEQFAKKIYELSENVKTIYFAYLYDIGNSNRSEIDDIERVKRVFPTLQEKRFPSALEKTEGKKDGVLILKKGAKRNVRV